MKMALEILGLGPCHHMKEVLPNPEQLSTWRSIAAGDPPDWEQAFAGYHSSVDWPSAYFWRELSGYYPNAGIILTVRSSDSWYRSMENTIFKVLKESTDSASIGQKLIAEKVFGGRIDDRDHAIAVYEKNIAAVQQAFTAERLLTYQLGEGWERLCQFLRKPVPDVPYPSSNSAEEFSAMVARFSQKTSE
jgi:hypothetical protein